MSICHVLWGRKTSSSLQYETEGLSKSAAGIKSNKKKIENNFVCYGKK